MCAVRTNARFWQQNATSQAVATWRGYAFENVCFNHVEQIKASLGVAGVISESSAWSKRANDENGLQIDLLISRNDNVINMCEIKYYGDDFAVSKDYYRVLLHRQMMLSRGVSPKVTIHNNIMIEYKGVKKVYGSDADSASATYIERRLVVRPILTTEADFDEAGTIQGKLAEPKVLELERDQLVHWDTYLLGRGTNLWGKKAPGFDVMPIEWWKNNSKAYGKLSSAFATYGTKITAVDENGSPVGLSQITAKPGTYTVTYEIGFELPETGAEPIRDYLTHRTGKEFPGYPEFPAEGNRMVLGSASLTAKVPYKLSYDANGGKGATPDEASFMKGASVTVANQGDLKKGKAEFVGWNTQADGKGTSYAAGQEVVFDADTTLYAQWKEAEVVITYDPNGGAWGGNSNKREVVVSKGTEIEIIEAPTFEGHTFLYWQGSEFQPGDKYTANANHTFTAIWKENKPGSNGTPGTSHSPKPAHKSSSRVQKKRVSKLPATGDNASYLAIALELFTGASLATAGALMLRRRKQL